MLKFHMSQIIIWNSMHQLHSFKIFSYIGGEILPKTRFQDESREKQCCFKESNR